MSLFIFHGLYNIAGIGRHLSDWQRRNGHCSDFFSYGDSNIVDPAHIDLQLIRYGGVSRRLLRFTLFLFCLVRYKVFQFYYGETFLPYGIDLPILRLFRKKIVMTYCGSDVRLIGIEMRRNRFGHLLKIGADHPRFDGVKRRKMQWQRLWVHRAIAPRNLYASVRSCYPSGKIVDDLWLHNTIDLARVTPAYRAADVPLVVHVPSARGIKGSEYVEAAILELQNAGVKFRFRLIEDAGHDEVLRILQEEADIVIDQMLLGGFGTLAVEAMASGKPVVGYLIDSVKDERFADCPIFNADIDNLADRLRYLIEHPEDRILLGQEGRRFVERHCDRELVNRRLVALYESL